MFNVTPETYGLLSLLIMVVSFLVAQIMSHPDPKPEAESKSAPGHMAATH